VLQSADSNRTRCVDYSTQHTVLIINCNTLCCSMYNTHRKALIQTHPVIEGQHTTATHYCNTLLQHTTATHYCNTLLQHTAAKHYCNTLLQHTTATHYCNTLLQHTTATHYCSTPLQHTTATHYCNTTPHSADSDTHRDMFVTHLILPDHFHVCYSYLCDRVNQAARMQSR